MPNNMSETIVNDVTLEAARLIRLFAPPAEHQNVKSRIATATRRLGWEANRVRDIWYSDQRIRVRASELEQLRAKERKNEEKAARHEFAELRDRIARLEALLVSTDPDMHSAHIDALHPMARLENRTLD
jgi:hypothetical protein